MTSPLPLVPRAHHVLMSMLLLTNLQLPSAIATLAPPGVVAGSTFVEMAIVGTFRND